MGNPSGKESPSTYTWTTQLSEGGLYIPTEEFFLQINKLEVIFQKYNKTGLKTAKEYIENLLNHTKEIEINAQVKKLFFTPHQRANISSI